MQERDPLRHPMQLYRYVGECLASKERIGLAMVISRSGSGPREAGAAMVITRDGKTVGTVVGGLFVAGTFEMAKTAIRDRCSLCRTFLWPIRRMIEMPLIP